jgi:predicted GIY-YIG superfamily endonuclease
MQPTAVYVLECEEGAWYVGVSYHPYRRYLEHLEDHGSFYTHHYKPIRIAHVQWYPTRKQAEYMETVMTALMRDVTLKVGGGFHTLVTPSGRGRRREKDSYMFFEEIKGRLKTLDVPHLKACYLRGKPKPYQDACRRGAGWLIRRAVRQE